MRTAITGRRRRDKHTASVELSNGKLTRVAEASGRFGVGANARAGERAGPQSFTTLVELDHRLKAGQRWPAKRGCSWRRRALVQFARRCAALLTCPQTGYPGEASSQSDTGEPGPNIPHIPVMQHRADPGRARAGNLAELVVLFQQRVHLPSIRGVATIPSQGAVITNSASSGQSYQDHIK